MVNTYNKLIDRFISWAKASSDIKSVFIVGSHARTDHPADEYSDLDLVMIVTDPEHYISSTQWLANIGDYWISFVEKTAVGGGKERRVLFENAMDVDFAVFSEEGFTQAIKEVEIQAVFKRGFRILLDKSGFVDTLPHIAHEKNIQTKPMQREFLNLVNDFWYHSVWTVKKLQRGELWAAKSCLDCYMKEHLLGIIECHAHVMNGSEYDTWHNGRFLDKWADQKVKEGLQNAFSHYQKYDIGRALLATMDLFRLLAVEAAEKMNYKYPYDADKNATQWVKHSLEGSIPS